MASPWTEHAFNFLDHALKCGDSLVGVDLDQLRTWSLEGSGERRFETVGIDVDIEKMVRLRQEIEAMPVLDIRDQQAKADKLFRAEAIAHDLKRAGDLLIASYYNTLKKAEQGRMRDELLAAAREGADVPAEWRQVAAAVDATGEAEGALRPFHWLLEFPEVFLAEGRAGFDAFVGNPPFIGGRRTRETLGDAYRSLLYDLWPGPRQCHYCRSSSLRCPFAYRRRARLDRHQHHCPGDRIQTGRLNRGRWRRHLWAANNTPWRGSATVVVDVVHVGRSVVRPRIDYRDAYLPNLGDREA